MTEDIHDELLRLADELSARELYGAAQCTIRGAGEIADLRQQLDSTKAHACEFEGTMHAAVTENLNLRQQLEAEQMRGAAMHAELLMSRNERLAEVERREKAEAALKPFAAIKPSTLYPSDGSEGEAYIVALAVEPEKTDFTGLDLARARAALSAPAQQNLGRDAVPSSTGTKC